MRIVSFDVGYKHLGLVSVEVSPGSVDGMEVKHCMLTNLLQVHCSECSMFRRRDRSTSHLITHYIELNDDIFREADVILIEQQPLVGLKAVEQCLYILLKIRYGEREGNAKKVRLISPRSVHAFFGMSNDYETRKLESEHLAAPFLKVMPAFQNANRKHDMSDAMIFVLYFIRKGLWYEYNVNRFASFSFNSKDL